MGLMILMGSARAQGAAPQGAPDISAEQPVSQACCQGQPMAGVLNFIPQSVCYAPEMGIYAVIDSIDNCVDVWMRKDGTTTRAFRYYTDSINRRHHVRTIYTGKGRHDLQFVLRPVSIGICGNKLIVLASSKRDSSYIAMISLCPKSIDTVMGEIPVKTNVISRIDFNCNAFAFETNCASKEILVAGKNALGYDLMVLSVTEEGISNANNDRIHYHIPKQAERIKESDPHRFGLAGTAIAVVFLALICIVCLLTLTSKIFKLVEKKNGPKQAADPQQEVYAAIAAAIHLYNEEQHDAEPTFITIQKTERNWTPWNAKYIGMNKYFSTRK